MQQLAARRPGHAEQQRDHEMRHSAPSQIRPYQRQALRDREDRRSEKGVEKPIAARKQQLARCHGVPSAETRLGDPIDGGEPGGQDPCGRDDHPWSKKSALKTLKDSHPVKVLQAEPGGKSGKYDTMIDDRSRQRTRRSRIHSCRETAHGLECGGVNAQLGENLRELCAFAPLRETRLTMIRFSQRRKGAKFAKAFW